MKGEFSTSKVFEPVKVGTVEIKNRMVGGPMVMNHATEDGHVTPRMIDYYAAKARGGFGLVHVEASYIRPDGNMFSRMLGVYSDRQLPGLNEIVEAVPAPSSTRRAFSGSPAPSPPCPIVRSTSRLWKARQKGWSWPMCAS